MPYAHTDLRDLTRALLKASRVPGHIADVVTDVLVGANLVGHDSHGVLRLPGYLAAIENGSMIPDAEPEIIRETATTVTIDGHKGLGIFTAHFAARLVIERAKQGEICSAVFRRIEHIGRLGHYAEMAAAAGCVAFVTVGRGTAGRSSVIPFGSREPSFGTNPIAFGIPTGDDTPFILDYATSVVAEGKLRVARSKGLPVPEGTIVDRNARPTTNTLDFYDGGSLLPFGAHKGSALMFLPCLLGSLGGSFNPETGAAGGSFIQAINVEAFTPLAAYQETVRTFLDTIKATAPAEGVAEVLVPGDFEQRNRISRSQTGIDLPDLIVGELTEWSERLAVPFPEASLG